VSGVRLEKRKLLKGRSADNNVQDRIQFPRLQSAWKKGVTMFIGDLKVKGGKKKKTHTARDRPYELG